MSYAIHKTEAIIMRLIPNGEANIDAVFLTKELGKITARVQAGRKIESKMRMQIARYNHVVIDAVRGKNFWRLTGVHQVAHHALFEDNEVLAVFHRAMGLAEHLIRGEDAHPELFDFFVGLLNGIDQTLDDSAGAGMQKNFLSRGEGVHREENFFVVPAPAEALELFAVIHVLEKLGYWQEEKLPETPTREILENLLKRKKDLVKMINESIEATQIV